MENNSPAIVAIDDNDDNLLVIRAFIRDAFPGSMVFTATNGKDGIGLAIEKNPDVILLDILMPGMDGFEVCTVIKGDRRISHIPVIFLTALKDDRNSRIRALEVGGEGFITKPFEEAEMIAQIRAMTKIKWANEQQLREKEDLTALVADRTSRLEQELAEHKATGLKLAEVNRALEVNKTELMHLLDDLNAEITARKVNEQALAESRTFLSDIVNTQPAGVYRVRMKEKEPFQSNGKLNIIYDFISNRYCELTGYSRDELEADPSLTLKLIHPDDINSFIEVNEKAVLSHTRFSWEGRMIVKAQTVWVRFESLPRAAANGDSLWTGVLIDITARKLTEETLIRVNQKLNVLSDLTRRDLISQIFILKSYLQLVKKNVAGQEPVLELLAKIEETIRFITEISEISLDFQDMGAKPPVWQNVNMSMLFGLSHITPGEIRHNFETGALEIFADPLLEKAFQGLFENSIRHGGHISMIRVSQRVVPEGVIILYEDDGVGIEAGKKEAIFQRDEYFRTSVRGLFFVREILDITGITIKETGEPGKGIRFEMTVPTGACRFAGGHEADGA